MFSSPLAFLQGNFIRLEYTATHQSPNLWEDAGQPNNPTTILVVIEDTAVVYDMRGGSLPAGSTIRLINKGYILGSGGNGGRGLEPGIPSQNEPAIPPTAGTIGSSALQISADLILDQSSGRIFGGGGGGGGGGNVGSNEAGGGGGGGVSGGLGGTGPSVSSDGTDAGTGINATPGTGGLSASTNADGGDGGDWGQSGKAGAGGGAAGGNGGFAISLMGYSISYIGDDEATLRANDLIKGVIS